MANLFEQSANWLPLKILLGALLVVILGVAGVTYYFTPKYTRVGYMPKQPVPFDHDLHVAQLGMDCRYCHSFVERSDFSNIPTTQTCMNCHRQILPDDPKLTPVRESWETGKPVRWVRIHELPDFAYFSHQAHVNRGISCVSCHGNVNHMREVWQHEPESMGWCLNCHRNPELQIRPIDKVFDLDWKPPAGPEGQETPGEKLVQKWGVHPTDNCGACHR
jgi:hypothetical protein